MTEEKQIDLNIGIGNKEPEKLKTAEVTIGGVSIKPVGTKGHKKVAFSCIHPDKPNEPFEISSVKYEVQPEKLKIVTTWYNLEHKENENDPDKLSKKSAVAHLMRYLEVNTLKDLEGKKIMTAKDENDYLVFKAY